MYVHTHTCLEVYMHTHVIYIYIYMCVYVSHLAGLLNFSVNAHMQRQSLRGDLSNTSFVVRSFGLCSCVFVGVYRCVMV